MAVEIVKHLDPAYEISGEIGHHGPFIFNSPHSGRRYPQHFLDQSNLSITHLRRSEDAWLDLLWEPVTRLGFPLIKVHMPRAFIDVNREPYELDPKMFEGHLPSFTNTKSMRVAGGLGTIPRIVGDGQEIYASKLKVEEALERIETLYKPYHRFMRQIMLKTRRIWGIAVLMDCHSMPSRSSQRAHQRAADIVIGDRHGVSCSYIISDLIYDFMTQQGYKVVRNKPYSGGFITEHYGSPSTGCHAIQLEINRALYMNEHTYEPHQGFEKLQANLIYMVQHLMCLSLEDITPWRTAAE